MIMWKQQKPTTLVAPLAAPGSNGSDMKLSTAIQKLMAEYQGPAASLKKYHSVLERFIGGDKTINAITIADVRKVEKALGSKVSAAYVASIKAHLAGIIRFVKTGVYKLNPEQDRAPTTRLKIGTAKLSDLMHLVGPASSGRFAALKSDVKKAIESCPEDEFRTVLPSKLMSEKKEERDAARTAVQEMMKQFHPQWIIRWAAGEEVFVVVKEEHWRAVMGKGTKQ